MKYCFRGEISLPPLCLYWWNVFSSPDFSDPPGWQVFIHSPWGGVIENRFSDFKSPPPTWFQIAPLITANYQYWNTLNTWWQMNYRAFNKKLTVTVSTCTFLQVLIFTVDFFWKQSTVTVKVYRCWQLQLTFSDKKSTVTVKFYRHWQLQLTFSKKVNCNCKKFTGTDSYSWLFWKKSLQALTVTVDLFEKSRM